MFPFLSKTVEDHRMRIADLLTDREGRHRAGCRIQPIERAVRVSREPDLSAESTTQVWGCAAESIAHFLKSPILGSSCAA
jgi:hypothetical protein